MTNRAGYLTVFSSDRSQIYGEFADAAWDLEETDGGPNHVFSGTASEGALDTFRRINSEGIDHVAFTFESNGDRYQGTAQLLAPEAGAMPGEAVVRIETGDEPARA